MVWWRRRGANSPRAPRTPPPPPHTQPLRQRTVAGLGEFALDDVLKIWFFGFFMREGQGWVCERGAASVPLGALHALPTPRPRPLPHNAKVHHIQNAPPPPTTTRTWTATRARNRPVTSDRRVSSSRALRKKDMKETPMTMRTGTMQLRAKDRERRLKEMETVTCACVCVCVRCVWGSE